MIGVTTVPAGAGANAVIRDCVLLPNPALKVDAATAGSKQSRGKERYGYPRP